MIDGWEIIALEDEGAVDALVLFRIEQPPVPGANVSAVLAEREGGVWTARAWTDPNPNAVAWWLAAEFGLPEPTDIDLPWQTNLIDAGEALVSAVAPDPEPFANGVLEFSPWSEVMGLVDDPIGVGEVLEAMGEPVAASTVTMAGSGGPSQPGEGGIEGDNCLHSVVTPEMMWTAVADSIEAEMVEEGKGNAVFDQVLGAACCTPRKFCGPWHPWTVWAYPPTWSQGPSTPFSGTCGQSVIWKAEGTRTRTRLCSCILRNCSTPACTETQTQRGELRTTELYDTGNPGCPDTDLPNVGPAGPPPPPPPAGPPTTATNPEAAGCPC